MTFAFQDGDLFSIDVSGNWSWIPVFTKNEDLTYSRHIGYIGGEDVVMIINTGIFQNFYEVLTQFGPGFVRKTAVHFHPIIMCSGERHDF